MTLLELEQAKELNSVEYRNRGGVNTLRSLADFVSDLGFSSEEELRDYFKQTRVLDAGSGYNGLAMALCLGGVDAQVLSINPTFDDPKYEIRQRDLISDRFKKSGFFQGRCFKDIEQARVLANQNTFVASAHNLPFESDYFDRVIDNFAVTTYFIERFSFSYRKSLEELIRVTKPEGKIRISPKTVFEDDWKMEVLELIGLPMEEHPNGIELTK